MKRRRLFRCAVLPILAGPPVILCGAQTPTASVPATYGPWRSAKIGGGGYVQNVVLCPSDPKRVYAYVDVGGVYRSDDGGRRWRMMNRTLRVHSVRSLSVDPRDANRVVIAVGDQWEGADEGLMESRDGGETWKLTQKAFFYGNADYRSAGVVLARDPKNPDVLLAASGKNGVFRSADGGNTWAHMAGADGLYPTDLKWDRTGSRVWLCARKAKVWREGELAGGYFRSDDGGRTWSRAADESPTELAQDAKDPSRWYVLFPDGDGPPVRVSRDGGATWADYTQGLPPPGEGGNVSDTRFDALGVGEGFAVLGSRRGTFWRRSPGDEGWRKVERAGATEVYEGEPWYGAMGPGKWQHFGSAMGSVVIDPRDPGRWFFTDWYAIYQSRDAGRRWELSMDGVEVTVLHTLTQDPTDPGVVHLGMADNGYLYSEDGGARFRTPHAMSNAKSIALSPKLPSRLYAAGDAGNGQWRANTVWVSIDRGRSWTRSPMTGLPDMSRHSSNSIAVDPRDPYTVYLAVSREVAPNGGGVYKSVDGGRSWTWMGQGLPEGGDGFFHHDIWSIGREVAVDAGGNLLAISTDRRKVYRWNAEANRWTLSKDMDAVGGNPRSLAADSKTPGRFFLGGARGGVWRTTDAGKTWERVLGREAEHVTVDAARPGRVAAGTVDGPAVSTDGGATWKLMDARLPTRRNQIVAFAGDRLLVGTNGSGAFWMPLTPAAEKPVTAKPATPATLPGAPGPAAALVNGDMERGSDAPDGWGLLYTGSGKLRLARDTTEKRQGAASLRLESVGGAAYGTAGQALRPVRGGETVRLSGWVKSAPGLEECLVAVQAFDVGGKQVGWTTLRDAKEARDWTRFEADVALPAGAASAHLLLTLKGDGKAWLDGVARATPVSVFPDR